MNKHLLNRRQFSARCAAFGLSFPALSAMIAAQASAQVLGTGAASKLAARTVKLPDLSLIHIYIQSTSLAAPVAVAGEGIHAQRNLIHSRHRYHRPGRSASTRFQRHQRCDL